jgi:hypothetical protein
MFKMIEWWTGSSGGCEVNAFQTSLKGIDTVPKEVFRRRKKRNKTEKAIAIAIFNLLEITGSKGYLFG